MGIFFKKRYSANGNAERAENSETDHSSVASVTAFGEMVSSSTAAVAGVENIGLDDVTLDLLNANMNTLNSIDRSALDTY